MRTPLWLSVLLAACAVDVAPASSSIVGGVEVGECGFPTTVRVGGGCTGTLVHPRVVVTAEHCGSPSTVEFGERDGRGIRRRVRCTPVPGSGRPADVQFCVLDEPMDIPITPILYGCELDRLVDGVDVVITGYGLTSYGNGSSGGIQRWAWAPLLEVRSEINIIGTPEASACSGDSGGPPFIRMDDGTWRVFGTVSGGTDDIPCNGGGAYPRIERFVPWFEEEFSIDITPCHDADGSWNPGPSCEGFFAGDHTGGQSWDSRCAGAPVGPASATCGPPNTPVEPDAGPTPEPDAGPSPVDAGSTPTADAGVSPNTDGGAPPVSDGAAPPGGNSGVDSRPDRVSGDCACRATAPTRGGAGLVLLLFGIAMIRRR